MSETTITLTAAEAALIDFVRNPPAGQHQIILRRWSDTWTVETIDFDSHKGPQVHSGETFEEAMNEVVSGCSVNQLKLHRTVG